MTPERLKTLIDGQITTDFMATESEEKLMSALKNIFPDISAEKKDSALEGHANLSRFKELAEKEQILAAVESILDDNVDGDSSHIDLNKIAALAGRIGIDEGSPIGKIRLSVPWKKA